MASSTAESGIFGSNISFGPRDGGNSWVVIAIVAGALVLALWIWKGRD